jgi:hypothetical protein
MLSTIGAGRYLYTKTDMTLQLLYSCNNLAVYVFNRQIINNGVRRRVFGISYSKVLRESNEEILNDWYVVRDDDVLREDVVHLKSHLADR